MNDHDVFADTMMIMQIWLAHTTSETDWACRFNHLNRVDLPTRYRGFSHPSMTDVATKNLPSDRQHICGFTNNMTCGM